MATVKEDDNEDAQKVVGSDEVVGDINCLICLQEYKNPRTLRCMHTFCEHCLSDYIVSLNLEKEKRTQFPCPFCRQEIKPPFPEKSITEWATMFKQNPMIISMLSLGKSKVEYQCCVCQFDGRSEPITDFCITCKEGFCALCTKYHRNFHFMKGHKFVSKDEMMQDPEEIMKLFDIFTCVEHDGEEIKFYCNEHKAECCVNCFLKKHRACSKVQDLMAKAKQMLAVRSPKHSVDKMKTLEIRLHKLVHANQSNILEVHSQRNQLEQEIHALRTHIKGLLDKLEKMVDMDMSPNYKEEVKKKTDNINQCLSLAAAIRSSYRMLELVSQHGSDIQLLLTLMRSEGQIKNYTEQMVSKFQEAESVDLTLEFHPYLKGLLSLNADDAAEVKIKKRREVMPVSEMVEKKHAKPLKECHIEKTGEMNIKCASSLNMPHYTGVAYLPGGNMMLVDMVNGICCMYDTNLQHISHYTFLTFPSCKKRNLWDVSVVSDTEVVVSVPVQNKLQFLNVGQEIKPIRSIATRFPCYGITTLDKDRIIVSGGTNTMKYYWGIISTSGEELSYHEIDREEGGETYLTVNDSRTRIYLSCCYIDTLFCFDLDGEPIFIYKRNDLHGPRGVGLDIEDSIYLVDSSQKVHLLSTDGELLKVIESEIPQRPLKLSFLPGNNSNCFFITSDNIFCLYQFQ